MKISEIMQKNVIRLSPEDAIKKALEVMEENKINGAPVVDNDNKLVGIIVKADIYRFLIEEGHYDTYPISSIMTKNVVSANADDEVMEAARKLVDRNIVAIPIVEKEQVVGIVSMENVIQYFIQMNEV
jgi:CBS domain-containing protein